MNVINIEKQHCKKIRAYLDSYLNNELLIETMHEVLNHLESCPECTSELEARERVKHLLQCAVRKDEAPRELEARIRKEIRQTPPRSNNHWIFAIAAALALMVGTFGVLRLWSHQDARPLESLQASDQMSANHKEEILRVGLGDHIHCALDAGLADEHFSAEKMTEKLGPDYAGIVAQVKGNIPGNYEVTVGHRCRYKGREFIHLILRQGEAVLSLVITKKDGEAFSETDAAEVAGASGIRLHQARLQDLQVAGFESRDYLAFVVSNLSEEDNLQIASTIAPSVRDFLDRRGRQA